MRILRFIVDGQIIKPDPKCDFNNLVPGTKDYLRAEFTFSSDWNGFSKTAKFYSMLGREYAACELKDGRGCTIPAPALEKKAFRIQISGTKLKTELITNRISVCQTGGDKV